MVATVVMSGRMGRYAQEGLLAVGAIPSRGGLTRSEAGGNGRGSYNAAHRLSHPEDRQGLPRAWRELSGADQQGPTTRYFVKRLQTFGLNVTVEHSSGMWIHFRMRILLRQLAHCTPVPSTYNTPLSTGRVSCHGRPLLSVRPPARRIGSTTSHCSSVNLPVSCHRRLRRNTEHFQNAPIFNPQMLMRIVP